MIEDESGGTTEIQVPADLKVNYWYLKYKKPWVHEQDLCALNEKNSCTGSDVTCQ